MFITENHAIIKYNQEEVRKLNKKPFSTIGRTNKRTFNANFGHTVGKFCTIYWIELEIFKGECLVEKHTTRYILMDNETLEEMFEKRLKHLVKIHRL